MLRPEDIDALKVAATESDPVKRKAAIIKVLEYHKSAFLRKIDEAQAKGMTPEEAQSIGRSYFEPVTRQIDALIDTSTTQCYRQFCLCKKTHTLAYCQTKLEECLAGP